MNFKGYLRYDFVEVFPCNATSNKTVAAAIYRTPRTNAKNLYRDMYDDLLGKNNQENYKMITGTDQNMDL